MNPFDNIVDSVNGAAGSVGSLFGSGKIVAYPKDWSGQVINEVKEDDSWKTSKGYSFQVLERDSDDSLDVSDDWGEFRLQINPQEKTQDEIFAVEISPTFKGVLVEHQGILLREITISGTTGISPKRKMAGALSNGRPALAGGHSGYIEFQELRNYLRMYAESKRKEGGSKWALVFRNYKDNEHFIVEVKRFKEKRKSMLYYYTIEMVAIGRASPPRRKKFFKTSFFDMLDKIVTAISDAAQLLSALGPFLVGIMSDFVDMILKPLESIVKSLQSIKKSGKALLSGEFTRKFFQTLKGRLRELSNNINDLLGRDMKTFNQYAGRTPTLSGQSGRESTYSELSVLNALQVCERAINAILQDNTIFTEDRNAEASKVESLYDDRISLTLSNTSREVTINGNDNIQTIAARELGDPDKFREIVLMNNLKPPYITTEDDTTSGSRVLRPGDTLLIPQQGGTPIGVAQGQQYDITKNLRTFEKSYGVDIALTKNNDLAISNTSDLDLIAGTENLAQGIMLKLYLERKGLKRHPSVGTSLGIGEKALHLTDLRNEVESSILSDQRVEAILYSQLLQDGNETKIQLVLKAKDIDQPIPISI